MLNSNNETILNFIKCKDKLFKFELLQLYLKLITFNLSSEVKIYVCLSTLESFKVSFFYNFLIEKS